MTDAQDFTPLNPVKREDFVANLVQARRAGGYTQESVEALVTNVVENTNELVKAYNALGHRAENAPVQLTGTDEADRLTKEAQVLFEETSRTAAAHIVDARNRADAIVAEAEAEGRRVGEEAATAAEQVRAEAQSWSDELHASTEAEIAAALEEARTELARLGAIRDDLEARALYLTSRLGEFHRQQLAEVEQLTEEVHASEPVETADQVNDAAELQDADVEVPVDAEPAVAAR